MKTTVEFIETFVKIEKLEVGEYGFYPFHLASEKDGSLNVECLALGGDVVACYKRFRNNFQEGANYIHMAVDFPAGGDIPHDFVAVFCYQLGEFSIIAIPYDVFSGEIYDYIKESSMLSNIEHQFKELAFTVGTPFKGSFKQN